MSGGIVRAPRPKRDFEQVPISRIRDRGLSYCARAVLERLLSNAEDYSMTAIAIAAESPREGRGAILKALKELRVAGYLVTRRIQNAAGRWSTQNVIYDTPTGVAIPDSGSPDSGLPTSGKPTLLDTSTSHTQKQQHRAARTGQDRAVLPEKEEVKKLSYIHGVEVWEKSDREKVDSWMTVHGADEVELAVADSMKENGRALPSQVEKCLEKRMKSKRAAEAKESSELERAKKRKLASAEPGVRERANQAKAAATAALKSQGI